MRTAKHVVPSRIRAMRAEIDRLNAQILEGLEQRAKLSILIAHEKAKASRRVFDPTRERAMLDSLKESSTGVLEAEAIEDVFRAVIRACRRAAAADLKRRRP